MKRFLLLIVILLFICGCSNTTKGLDNNNTTYEENEKIISDTPKYVDENPLVVGLYKNGKLIDDYNVNIKPSTDIGVFDVYFTNENNVYSTNTKYNFNKYASNYENINKYKIGFQVSFVTDNGEVTKVITGPKDMYVLSPYIFNYLYDDVHQTDGAWYSHLEEKDINESTIYSSIKLYATDDIYRISSPIKFTVFTYDTEDDFDIDGLYRGNSKYTITINNLKD